MKILDAYDTQTNATKEFTQINTIYQSVPCIRTDDDIKLPQGVELTSIDGTGKPPEDIGKALQFLEFCAAFGKLGYVHMDDFEKKNTFYIFRQKMSDGEEDEEIEKYKKAGNRIFDDLDSAAAHKVLDDLQQSLKFSDLAKI